MSNTSSNSSSSSSSCVRPCRRAPRAPSARRAAPAVAQPLCARAAHSTHRNLVRVHVVRNVRVGLAQQPAEVKLAMIGHAATRRRAHHPRAPRPPPALPLEPLPIKLNVLSRDPRSRPLAKRCPKTSLQFVTAAAQNRTPIRGVLGQASSPLFLYLLHTRLCR